MELGRTCYLSQVDAAPVRADSSQSSSISYFVLQDLRKGTITIICGAHDSVYAGKASCAADNADLRRPLVMFPAGDLYAACFHTQGPLALKAVSNPGTDAAATVGADYFHFCIEKGLVKYQNITSGIPCDAKVSHQSLAGAGISNSGENLWLWRGTGSEQKQ